MACFFRGVIEIIVFSVPNVLRHDLIIVFSNLLCLKRVLLYIFKVLCFSSLTFFFITCTSRKPEYIYPSHSNIRYYINNEPTSKPGSGQFGPGQFGTRIIQSRTIRYYCPNCQGPNCPSTVNHAACCLSLPYICEASIYL